MIVILFAPSNRTGLRSTVKYSRSQVLPRRAHACERAVMAPVAGWGWGRLEGRGTWLATAGNNWGQDPTLLVYSSTAWAGVFLVRSSSAPAEMVACSLYGGHQSSLSGYGNHGHLIPASTSSEFFYFRAVELPCLAAAELNSCHRAISPSDLLLPGQFCQVSRVPAIPRPATHPDVQARNRT